MDLSAAQRTDRERIKQDRIAQGECIYCGTMGHFLQVCPERAAARARRLAVAAATVAAEAVVPNARSEN